MAAYIQFTSRLKSTTQDGILAEAQQIAVSSSDNTSIKSYIDSKVASAAGAAYRPKGSVTFAALSALTSANVGDVYNITDAFTLSGKSYAAGSNVACLKAFSSKVTPDETYWDVLGGFIDLSPYAKSTELNTAKSDLQGKIDATNANVSTLARKLDERVDSNVVLKDMNDYYQISGADDSHPAKIGKDSKIGTGVVIKQDGNNVILYSRDTSSYSDTIIGSIGKDSKGLGKISFGNNTLSFAQDVNIGHAFDIQGNLNNSNPHLLTFNGDAEFGHDLHIGTGFGEGRYTFAQCGYALIGTGVYIDPNKKMEFGTALPDSLGAGGYIFYADLDGVHFAEIGTRAANDNLFIGSNVVISVKNGISIGTCFGIENMEPGKRSGIYLGVTDDEFMSKKDVNSLGISGKTIINALGTSCVISCSGSGDGFSVGIPQAPIAKFGSNFDYDKESRIASLGIRIAPKVVIGSGVMVDSGIKLGYDGSKELLLFGTDIDRLHPVASYSSYEDLTKRVAALESLLTVAS